MAQTHPTDAPPAPEPATAPRRRHLRRRFPLGIVALAATGVATAASWFYFRKSQPVTDELTRDRLRPREGSGA